MKVSILLLTIDRFELTRAYVGQALKRAGHEFDLCITDNGSTDKRIFEWCEYHHPKIYNRNEKNEGTAQSLNRMIKQNPSDYYVFIGNDIELPNNWLKSMLDSITRIPESGVVGINWRPLEYPTHTYNGVEVWHTERTFGTMMVSQTLRDKLGNFCEEYGVYGLWDSDYSIRATEAGFKNYYIKGLRSEHQCNDVGEDTEYRRMKDKSIEKAKPIFELNVQSYKQGLKLYQQCTENN